MAGRAYKRASNDFALGSTHRNGDFSRHPTQQNWVKVHEKASNSDSNFIVTLELLITMLL